jgi:hypothetical protein
MMYSEHIFDNVFLLSSNNIDSFVSIAQTMENIPELDFDAHYIDPITSNDIEVQKVCFIVVESYFVRFIMVHFRFQLLRMLPDAGYRLKWVYGVEAFQRWAKQRNQPLLTVTSEGKTSCKFLHVSSIGYSSSNRMLLLLLLLFSRRKSHSSTIYNQI